jgi:hypothetical protein
MLYGMLSFRWVGLGPSPKAMNVNIPTAPIQAYSSGPQTPQGTKK